ncbi:MAG: D-alanyl-D-alanine carboxypeptidase family protein [Rhizobiaceae bacterium]
MALLASLLVAFTAACSTTETMRVQPTAMTASGDPEKHAVLVIDGNTGRTLHAVNAEAPRYPASLTKMMTLYMLFEAMDAGRVTPDTQIVVSSHAASQPPSKMRIRAGDSIDAATAVSALATKSANDVAAAVGEHLGGSEEQFAAMMTSKARQLGMRRTVFRNASGLSDTGQYTTARDMAILGMSLQKRFPHRFGAFSATSFNFRGRGVRGHNDLLGRVQGVDGIKTGYIRASGFNIVTSVRTGGRKLIVVVMGGRTARARNAEVEALIQNYLPQASVGGSS